ncbi:unnamed protein product [Effrenium voratum]|uniref:Uncharacterized protein n=1 Tax=Effrenium voratum TaxID=2562239 RepID=A0AA36HYH1_9DINO|nr:unnamed protein product [Effrenium voratum]
MPHAPITGSPQVIYTTAGGALANLLHKMSDDEEVDKGQLVWAALGDTNVKICCVGVAFALIAICAAWRARLLALFRYRNPKNPRDHNGALPLPVHVPIRGAPARGSHKIGSKAWVPADSRGLCSGWSVTADICIFVSP